MYPVRLRNCSRIHRVSDRSKSPWYLLALISEEDFMIKKNESISPWKTPMKINAEMASKWVEVFINQM